MSICKTYEQIEAFLRYTQNSKLSLTVYVLCWMQ